MGYNTRLVEEFGRLERLCGDIYDEKYGVTMYINDMTESGYYASRYVDGWDYDYRCLKAVRNKRNKLSHGEVLFDTPYATEEDISFIVNFTERILNQTDPLTVYRKTLHNTTPNITPEKNREPQIDREPNYSSYRKASRAPVGCAFFAIGVPIIIAVVTIIFVGL